jgi:parvulin-like peptidyl-prolyl isomerase
MSIQGMRKRFAVHFRYVLYILIGVFIVGLSALFSPLGSGLRGSDKQQQADQPNAAAKDTIALVNGKPVTRGEVDDAFLKDMAARQQQLSMMPGYSVTIQQFKGLRQSALETAIGNAVIAQEAVKRGIHFSSREVEARMDQIVDDQVKQLQQMAKGQDVERIYAQAVMSLNPAAGRQDKVSEGEFRDVLRQAVEKERAGVESQMIVDQLKKVVAPPTTAKEEDLLASYDQVTLRELRVAMKPEGKPARTDEEARKRAEELRAKLQAGTDFATLAKAESDDPRAKKEGGLLPAMSLETLPAELQKPVAALKEGQITEPLRTQFGSYEILRLEVRARQLPKDFEKNKAQLLSDLSKRKQDEAWEKFARELRVKAKVDVKDTEYQAYAAMATGKPADGLKLLQKAAEDPQKLGLGGGGSVNWEIATQLEAKQDWQGALDAYTRADDALSGQGSAQSQPKLHYQTLLGMARMDEKLSGQLQQQGKLKDAQSKKDEAIGWYQAAADLTDQQAELNQLAATFERLGRKDLADQQRQQVARLAKEEAERQKAMAAQQAAAAKKAAPPAPGTAPKAPEAKPAVPEAKPAPAGNKPAAPVKP